MKLLSAWTFMYFLFALRLREHFRNSLNCIKFRLFILRQGSSLSLLIVESKVIKNNVKKQNPKFCGPKIVSWPKNNFFHLFAVEWKFPKRCFCVKHLEKLRRAMWECINFLFSIFAHSLAFRAFVVRLRANLSYFMILPTFTFTWKRK